MRGESIHSNADVDAHVEVRDSNEFVESGTLDYIQMVVKRFGNEKYISGHGVYSPFWEALQFLFGFEQMMVNLSMNPSLVEHTHDGIPPISWTPDYAICRRPTSSYSVGVR